MSVKNPNIYVKEQPEGKNSLARSLRHGQCTITCRSDPNCNKGSAGQSLRAPRNIWPDTSPP